MPYSPNNMIIVPADVPGSWESMLAIYDKLQQTGGFFTWKNDDDFEWFKAQKSETMALLLRELSELPLRDSFRVGAGLHGVGLMLPYDETRKLVDSRMVSLRVTPDRQIEIRLLDVRKSGVRYPILKYAVCRIESASETVVEFTKQLPGTKIKAPWGEAESS